MRDSSLGIPPQCFLAIRDKYDSVIYQGALEPEIVRYLRGRRCDACVHWVCDNRKAEFRLLDGSNISARTCSFQGGGILTMADDSCRAWSPKRKHG